jgi:hypothetical protein
MLDRRSSFCREFDEAAGGRVSPRSVVIKDQHARHNKPGLKVASLVEVQVIWQMDGLGLRRIVQPTQVR